MRPIRTAPAVWELEGPTITGPRISKMSSISVFLPVIRNCSQRITSSPFPQEVFPGKLTFLPPSFILGAERSVTAMSSLLLRNLRTILTCDDGDAVLEHADLYCENGIIRVWAQTCPRPQTL